MNKEINTLEHWVNYYNGCSNNEIYMDMVNDRDYIIKLEQENKELKNINKELYSRIDDTYKLLIQFCNENQPYLDEIEHCCKTKIEFAFKLLKGDSN